MKREILKMMLAGMSSLAVISCSSSSDDTIGLAGDVRAAAGTGEAIFQKAKAADGRGKKSKAIKLYDRVADIYPTAPSAAQARFRQAELLQKNGDTLKAFKAYQLFITRYQGSGLYSTAIKRQANMAQAAARGETKTSFAMIKRNIAPNRIIEMLAQVRDNAPKTDMSATAQFMIAETHESQKKPKKAIIAYRKLVRDQPQSSRAPESLFRVGKILVAEADRGNRNQATLELAAEAFNDYLIQYPSHSKNGEARRMLSSLKKRELNRSLDIAEHYYRTGQYESAKVYYREIVRENSSGATKDKARARLKELGE